MQNVYIVGAGVAPVGEHYTRSMADLALEAFNNALADTSTTLDLERIGALYVANAMAETLGGQAQLGVAMAEVIGLEGIEALRLEAAGASGGVAVRQAALMVASGVYDLVAVLGAEKVMDRLQAVQEKSLALALDTDFEAEHGATLTTQWALLMRRYMHEYGYAADAFAPFPVNAHTNGQKSRHALYRFGINADKYRKANQVSSPINMLDSSTLADGAAVVLIASERLAQELSSAPVRIAGSSLAVDTLALHSRRDPLWLGAVERGTRAALQQAQITHADVDVLELSDPHGIAAALALEAGGFVERGTAPSHAADGGITPTGTTPLATAGGYKARGNVGGATGIYQMVEIVQQVRGQAGATQVADAKTGLAQCLGGIGATAVTHILCRG
jgi:acetyl-CoA C-acetyltransferase